MSKMPIKGDEIVEIYSRMSSYDIKGKVERVTDKSFWVDGVRYVENRRHVLAFKIYGDNYYKRCPDVRYNGRTYYVMTDKIRKEIDEKNESRSFSVKLCSLMDDLQKYRNFDFSYKDKNARSTKRAELLGALEKVHQLIKH